MVRKADRIWALYKGEEMLSVGTVKEIARDTGKKPNTLLFMTTPAYKKRAENCTFGYLEMVEVE